MQGFSKKSPQGALLFFSVGFLLLAGHFALIPLSSEFFYGRLPPLTPTLAYIALAAAMGVCVPILVWLIPRVCDTRRLLLFVFIVGLGARGSMFFTTPILEDDFYRYLWDGASVAKGVDPYKFAPVEAAQFRSLGLEIPNPDEPATRHLNYQGLLKEAFETTLFNSETPPTLIDEDLYKLRQLALVAPKFHSRVSYPKIKTIYSPITQSAFTLAHLIAPFNLTSWRFVLLLVDLTAFALLLAALKAYGRPLIWSALYWCNPIITLEVFNSGHMDVLIVPFIFGALWCSKLKKPTLAMIALAGATAVKIWPILLAPAFIRPFLKQPLKLLSLSLVFGLTVLVLMGPQLIQFNDPQQGLSVYSTDWRRNTFLFSVIADLFLPLFTESASAYARIVVTAIIATAALFLASRAKHVSKLPQILLATVGVLFFFSPTGFVWYITWLIPFICFKPSFGMAALAITGPLYYTRFLLGDANWIYQWGIVPIAFGVPLILIAIELIRSSQAKKVECHAQLAVEE